MPDIRGKSYCLYMFKPMSIKFDEAKQLMSTIVQNKNFYIDVRDIKLII